MYSLLSFSFCLLCIEVRLQFNVGSNVELLEESKLVICEEFPYAFTIPIRSI